MPDPTVVNITEAPNFLTGLRGLSLREARAVALIHELLHVANSIPKDGGNTGQSILNTMLVKLFCITLPNIPISTTDLPINTSLPLLPVGGGGGGGDREVGGVVGFAYGYPGWWYSMWDFVSWVNSIPVGGGHGYLADYYEISEEEFNSP